MRCLRSLCTRSLQTEGNRQLKSNFTCRAIELLHCSIVLAFSPQPSVVAVEHLIDVRQAVLRLS